MSEYAILLRGVNVGGRIIKMAELKVCLEGAGLNNVKTLLQSGNVICESPMSPAELKRHIEQVLSETFSYLAKAIVLPKEELQAVIDGNPFKAAPAEYHQYVIFFENGLEQVFCQEVNIGSDDEVKEGKGIVYWKVAKGQTLKTPVAKLLAKTQFRNFNTNRNINTLVKMTGL